MCGRGPEFNENTIYNYTYICKKHFHETTEIFDWRENENLLPLPANRVTVSSKGRITKNSREKRSTTNPKSENYEVPNLARESIKSYSRRSADPMIVVDTNQSIVKQELDYDIAVKDTNYLASLDASDIAVQDTSDISLSGTSGIAGRGTSDFAGCGMSDIARYGTSGIAIHNYNYDNDQSMNTEEFQNTSMTDPLEFVSVEIKEEPADT